MLTACRRTETRQNPLGSWGPGLAEGSATGCPCWAGEGSGQGRHGVHPRADRVPRGGGAVKRWQDPLGSRDPGWQDGRGAGRVARARKCASARARECGWVGACVCGCIRMCACVSLVCARESACGYVRVCARVCMCASACVWARTRVRVCACVCARTRVVCARARLWACTRVCVRVRVFSHVRVCEPCVYARERVWVRTCVRACECVCVCASACVWAHTRVRVCACVCARTRVVCVRSACRDACFMWPCSVVSRPSTRDGGGRLLRAQAKESGGCKGVLGTFTPGGSSLAGEHMARKKTC